MLRIAKVGRDGLDYYLDPALVDVECGDATGSYLGGLARTVGLLGVPADGRTLPALLAGVDPITGELLDGRHDRVRVLAYDCTFAAPKSVSLLALLDGGGEAVVAAHRRSAAAAFGYLEREAALLRRPGVGTTHPDGVAAAVFLHRTSRSNDPHLHSHLLLANLGAEAGGRYTALDGRGLYAELATAGSLYRCQLRHELSRELGVVWRAERRGFNDVSGLPPRVLSEFSQRSAEIAGELASRGVSGQRAADLAAHRTRSEKERDRSLPALSEEWRRRRERSGVAPSQLAELRAARRVGASGDPAAAVRRGGESFPDRFSRSELLRAASSALPAGAPIDALEVAADEFLESGLLVSAPARRTRHGSRREIPGARAVPTYLTEDVARLQQENGALLGAAMPLPPGVLPPPGLYRVGELATVAALAERSRRSGLPLRALARSPGLAAHLEGLSGVPSAALSEATQPRGGGGLVLFGPEQLAARALAPLLARARHEAVFVVDRNAPVADGPVALPAEVRIEEAGAVRVHRAETPRAALGAFALLARRLELEGGVVAVTADPSLLGRESVPPHLLRQALRGRPGAAVLVLGPARLLGGGAAALEDCRRIHVVVAPGREVNRGALLEIAAPRQLTERLGPPPIGLESRERWRKAATRAERLPADAPPLHRELRSPALAMERAR